MSYEHSLTEIDLALTSSTMIGAGPYTTLVRSYRGPYLVTLQLDIVPEDREIVQNTEYFVNFKVQYFFSANNVSGLAARSIFAA